MRPPLICTFYLFSLVFFMDIFTCTGFPNIYKISGLFSTARYNIIYIFIQIETWFLSTCVYLPFLRNEIHLQGIPLLTIKSDLAAYIVKSYCQLVIHTPAIRSLVMMATSVCCLNEHPCTVKDRYFCPRSPTDIPHF